MKTCLYFLLGCIFLCGACGGGGNEDSVLEGGSEIPGNPVNVSFLEEEMTEMENGGVVQVGLHLSASASSDFTVALEIVLENNMIEGTDYLLRDKEIRLTAGDSLAFVELELIDNQKVDPGRYLELRIIEVGGEQVLNSSRCRINVVDDESQSAVVFVNRETDVNERDEMIRFPLVLQGTPLGNVHFKVEQVGGTAVEGVDYSWRVQELELNNTLDTAYVELELLDNNTSDLIRTLVLEVTEVQGGYSLTSSSNILVNLRDDDVTLFFGATSYGVAETDKFLLIPLRLSQPLLEDMEIILDVFGESAVEGVDFTVEKTLSIPAGHDSTMVVVYVEDIEGYSADKQLSLVVKACGGNVGYSDAVCNVAIWDCDTRLFFEEVPSVRSNASAFDVNVGLERALAHDVRFYVRSNSSIFIGAKEGYVIPAGQMSQVITVNMSREIDRDGDFEIFIENEYGAVSESRDVDVCVRWPIDKSNWSIDLNNSVTGGRATVLHLIDGNESTVWTNYSEFTGADNVPYEAVVSLGGVTDISYFELVRPSTDIMTLKVEICITNAENWESGDWSEPIECEFSNAIYGGKVEYTWPTSQRATFVKVRVVDCMIDAGVGAKMGSLSELILY